MHENLMAALAQWNPALGRDIARDTPLLTTGRLDSASVFQLLLWVEEHVGRPVDVTKVDMPVEWNTIDLIVAFVERERVR
ncbi:MAG TPA: hypothetical protein VFH88_06500 [Candidatus Krumholzibacteria bacterium]|nr:hypothetical protein [Candidatus Krumholzibacteria bacterium]